ncbi:MAG: T9SS type A sorting domain-containing protein, partial [Bacteroidota bacterium]
ANNGTAARTTDGGVTWTSVTLPGSGASYAMSGSGLDFFATRGGNVYRSTDRGATWSLSWTGTIGTTLWHCSFAASGSNIRGWVVSGTGGIGAFYGGLTGVDEGEVAGVPLTFALEQNYPNPFNPTTTLRYSLPKDARVTLAIYNILGQRVVALKDEVQNIGFYNVLWNGRNDFGTSVASGVYFYRIEAKPVDGSETFMSIKKMLMLK